MKGKAILTCVCVCKMGLQMWVSSAFHLCLHYKVAICWHCFFFFLLSMNHLPKAEWKGEVVPFGLAIVWLEKPPVLLIKGLAGEVIRAGFIICCCCWATIGLGAEVGMNGIEAGPAEGKSIWGGCCCVGERRPPLPAIWFIDGAIPFGFPESDKLSMFMLSPPTSPHVRPTALLLLFPPTLCCCWCFLLIPTGTMST